MSTKQTDAYGSLGQGKTLKLDPDKIHILGLDDADIGHRLLDPTRVDKPAAGLVVSMRKFGFRPTEAIAVRRDGDRVICVDGRQRVMAARIIKREQLAAGSEVTIRVVAIIDSSSNPEVTFIIANEHHREDSPLVKARKAEHMRSMNYDEKEIGAMFNVSRATLGNWNMLLACVPQAQKLVESGTLSYNAAYELGKLPASEQLDKLTEAAHSNGHANDSSNGAAAAEPTRRERSKAVKSAARGEKSGRWTSGQVRALAEAFEPDAPEKKGDEPNYEDGNTEFAHRLIAVLIGEDETGKGLAAYPTVQKAVKKILKQAKAES